MKPFIITLFLLTSLSVFSQTSLSAGDIAFLSVNSDEPKNFAFIILTDIDSGTVINFTDDAWVSDSVEFRKAEGSTTFKANDNYPKGTTFTFPGFSDSIFTKNPNFLLSGTGDNLIAYQITEMQNYVFLYGIGWAETVAGNWTFSDAKKTNTSDIPPGLSVENNTILYLGSKDNYQFCIPDSMLVITDTVLRVFSNKVNYIGTDTGAYRSFTLKTLTLPELSNDYKIFKSEYCSDETISDDTIYSNLTFYIDSIKTEEFNFDELSEGTYTVWMNVKVGKYESNIISNSFSVYENPDIPGLKFSGNTIIAELDADCIPVWFENNSMIPISVNEIILSKTVDIKLIQKDENGCSSEAVEFSYVQTGIKELKEDSGNYQYYNLNGQRIETSGSGITIKQNMQNNKIVNVCR